MKILDMFAGRRAIWFNKNHPMTTFVDKRAEVTRIQDLLVLAEEDIKK